MGHSQWDKQGLAWGGLRQIALKVFLPSCIGAGFFWKRIVFRKPVLLLRIRHQVYGVAVKKDLVTVFHH